MSGRYVSQRRFKWQKEKNDIIRSLFLHMKHV